MNPIDRMRTPEFLIVLILFLVMNAVAYYESGEHAGKEREGAIAHELGQAHGGEESARRPNQSLEGAEVVHTVVYCRIIFSIWIAIILVTVALCLFILGRHSPESSNYWVIFWTFGYLAYIIHFYWSAGVLFNWNLVELFHSHIGQNINPEKVVDNPIPDLILTGVWGIDVFLAWRVLVSPMWVRIAHLAVGLFVLVVFVGATVLAAKAGPVAHALGILLIVSIVSSGICRMIHYGRARHTALI